MRRPGRDDDGPGRSVGPGVLLLVIAVALGAGALVWAQRSLDRTATAQGVVTGVATRDTDEGVDFARIVEFRAGDRPVTFTDAVHEQPRRFDVGDLVTVAYDPDDPDNAAVTSGIRTFGRWVGIAALGATSALLAGAGAQGLRRR